MNGARFAYLKKLCKVAAEYDDIYFVSCDFGAPCFDDFRRDFPLKFVNVGIAEQNMIAVSCGLALAGKRVIAHSPSPFPVTRAFDQIKCAAAVMKLPIQITVHGTGFSQPWFGATHFQY